MISGTVWADTNQNQVRDAGELVKSGVTVTLLTSPGGAVAGTTTTDTQGRHTFTSPADGACVVQVTAPIHSPSRRRAPETMTSLRGRSGARPAPARCHSAADDQRRNAGDRAGCRGCSRWPPSRVAPLRHAGRRLPEPDRHRHGALRYDGRRR
ncbi:SdrD B-like domain-containing protein [Leifsonia sp. L25]|uniref:SdrD B-like domain-containing protein n=1 Tax=Leifsonia sp. L25 TaxID=3423957 RepID=UPI003D687555